MAPNFNFLAKLNWKVDTKPLATADAATKKLDKSTKELGKASKKTEGDAKNLAKGLDSINKSAKKSKESLNKLGGDVAKFGKSFATVAAGVILAAGAMVAALAVSIAKTNEETTAKNRLARSMGMASLEYSYLGNAIKSLGFEPQKAIEMIDELNKVLGEAKADPTKLQEFKKELKELGIDFKSFTNLKPNEKLQELLTAMAELKDPDRATALADKLLKGDATKIVGALKNSETTLDVLIGKQKALSFESEKSRKDAEDFTKTLDKVTGQLDSIKAYSFAELGAQLTPLLEDASNYLSDNKESIITKIDKFIEDVVAGVKSIWEYFKNEDNQTKIKETFDSIKEAFKAMGKAVDELKPILTFLTEDWKSVVATLTGKGVTKDGVDSGDSGPSSNFNLEDAFSTQSGKAVEEFLKELDSKIPLMKPAFDTIFNIIIIEIKDLFSNLWKNIVDGAKEVAFKIVTALNPLETFFANLYNNYIRPIVGAVSGITLPKPNLPTAPTPVQTPPVKKIMGDYGPPEMKSYFDFQTNTPKQMKSVPVGSQTSGTIPVSTVINNKSNDTYVINNEWTINTKVTKEFNEQELKRIVNAQQDERAATMFQSRSKRT
jgi:ABC-type transporter Mla subunit MlaD